ncbi:MAG: Hsp70 family protein [Desulfamplus sp.]|nr:Hsp70 family protein [Desulfamplus sp.]
MKEMINFGIDLGTSNSLIAKFNTGRVEVFKNPRGHKECLQSVVGFRKDKIVFGDNAKTYAEKDPKNVASRFKRKMGTTETIRIESLDTSKTPVELSAFILKELKSFVHSGEKVDSAVITIPASFDTIQSNATKEAGIEAGLKDVVLLQEPIAASLAYANKNNAEELKNSQWLVYDLGGGTFDVALVKIIEGELTIVDHEGDNYLGGTDFDAMIVENIFVPALEANGNFDNLLHDMKSATGRYNREWFKLLHAAEMAKIELSSELSTDVSFEYLSIEIKDDEGDVIDLSITITRSEFEALIKDKVTETTQMMKKILTRQSLQPKDLQFILMVGGSTYISFVRRYVEETMGITVKTDIDPTNAIVVGAAFFAGSKPKSSDKTSLEAKSNYKIKVRAIYERSSQEKDEMFSAKFEGDITGMTYRIYRQDGGFDSGTKVLKNRITEDLPLRESEYNIFEFQIRDSKGNIVATELDQIQIAQGRYSIAGQQLPDELSLVLDDLKNRDARLEPIFNKNCVLPTRAKKTVEMAKTVVKGSDDNIVSIMVVEGSSKNHYLSNKPIGNLKISGKMLNRDLLKGTEIDITFELSESRDLTISAYLNGTGQEFSQVFNPKNRDVKPKDLSTDILLLETMVLSEQEDAAENNDNETERGLEKVLEGVQSLIMESGYLPEDDVTDKKFQLEDKKRALANELYQMTSGKRLNKALSEYQDIKNSTIKLVQEHGNDHEKHLLKEITGREEVFLCANSPLRIEEQINALQSIRYQILMRLPGYLVGMFEYLVENRVSMNDQTLVKQLIENGKRCIESESWEDLRMVIGRLWNLMPEEEKEVGEYRFITGII